MRPRPPRPPVTETAAYVRWRLTGLDETYHAGWPRWTYADYVAVSELLRRAEQKEPADVAE